MNAPAWLHLLSIASLASGGLCALVLAIDEGRRPQRMAIMNLVWPVTALFGQALTVLLYLRFGRSSGRKDDGTLAPATPFPAKVAKGALHCGAGCCLGDITAEWLGFAFPGIAVWFGLGSIFTERAVALWAPDYILAFLFGVAFQYFTIAPMRGLGFAQGLKEAVEADALSLTAWQIGMYGFMAFANFVVFRRMLGVRLAVDSPEFWFMMQIAMNCGFLTSYPANWLLIRLGIKEAM